MSKNDVRRPYKHVPQKFLALLKPATAQQLRAWVESGEEDWYDVVDAIMAPGLAKHFHVGVEHEEADDGAV